MKYQPVIEFSFDPKALRLILDTLRELLTDANLCFSRRGLSICGIDPNRLVIVDLQLESASEMVMNDNEEIFFGVYIPFLYKMLRYCSPSDKAFFQLNASQPDTLKLVVVNDEGSTAMTSSFKNIMIPVDRYPANQNNSEYFKCRIPSIAFAKQLKEVGAVSKNIKIAFGPNELNLYGSNENSSVIRANKNVSYLDKSPTEVCEYTFILRYLDKFIKPNLSEVVTLRFGANLPMEISHSFDKGVMRMIISPITWNFDEMETQGPA